MGYIEGSLSIFLVSLLLENFIRVQSISKVTEMSQISKNCNKMFDSDEEEIHSFESPETAKNKKKSQENLGIIHIANDHNFYQIKNINSD